MEQLQTTVIDTIIQPQQILLPKKVYIGDTAELRCTFNSNNVVFSQLVMDGTAEINLSAFVDPLDIRDYEIQQVILSPAGINYYQLSIIFKPWKTGDILFPPIHLKNVQIELQPVQIVSITEQNNATTIKDTVAPFLLPGTTYKLYGTLILLLILVIIGIRIFIKRDKILLYINNKKLIRKYKKNKKKTIKELKLLADTTEPDQIFAEKYQHLMRNYLEIRFDYAFSKTTSSEMAQGFLKATNNLASDIKTEAFGDIAATFIRTDYIRYKSESIFFENEKKDLCNMVIAKIEILENTKEDSEGGEIA